MIADQSTGAATPANIAEKACVIAHIAINSQLRAGRNAAGSRDARENREREQGPVGRGITIEDVAKAAAVSRQTVSRVINRSPRVSAEARARVEQAIADLAWVPNLAARSMAGGRSRLLLVVFTGPPPGTEPALPLGNLLLAGTAACSAQGYRLLFEQLAPGLSPAAATAQLAATLGAVQPDGAMLLLSVDDQGPIRALIEPRGIPCETLHATGETPGNPGEAAARHLLALGHKQIGFIAGARDPARTRDNLAGYRRVLAQKGSRAHRHFVAESAPDLAATLDLARSWLVPTIRPTAIIAESAATALAVLHVAKSLKLAVPRDLSLIALEDDAALAASQPPVAVLHEPAAALFAAACERLIARAEADPATPPEPPALPLTLELAERATLARAPRPI
jgi:LacI family transcriptional regulator